MEDKLRRLFIPIALSIALSACTSSVPQPLETTPVMSWTGSYAGLLGTVTESGAGDTCPEVIVHHSVWQRPGKPWSPPGTFTNTLQSGSCKVQ